MTPAELEHLKTQLQAHLSAAAEDGQPAVHSFPQEALAAVGSPDHQGPFAVVTGNEHDPSVSSYAPSGLLLGRGWQVCS